MKHRGCAQSHASTLLERTNSKMESLFEYSSGGLEWHGSDESARRYGAVVAGALLTVGAIVAGTYGYVEIEGQEPEVPVVELESPLPVGWAQT